MMPIVDMEMCVASQRVCVRVLVAFAQMQPHPYNHQRRCNPERPARRLRQEKKRKHRADEGRGGKVSPGARGPEMAQGEHEKGETDAVTKKTDRTRSGGDRERRHLLRK